MIDVLSVWNSKEYEHLRNNKNIENIMFLTLGGSHAYGTNVEGSDIDIRGVCLNPSMSLIGLSPFEQEVCIETDTTIYSFNKIIQLLINCNPNTIELLGCKNESYYIPDTLSGTLGRLLLKGKNLFLSKRAAYSFGGYATAQLRRLQNAVGREKVGETLKQKHILDSIKNAWIGEGGIAKRHGLTEHLYNFFFDENNDLQLRPTAMGMTIASNRLCAALSEINNIVSTYDKLNKRNSKKDDVHLNKHAMHLVRLYLMAFDILEKEEINTYRENDIDFLLTIRNGKYQLEDGTFSNELFDLIDEYEKRLDYAKNNTSLPEQPNIKDIEEFVSMINWKSLYYNFVTNVE